MNSLGMSSLLPVRELKKTEFLERKQMEKMKNEMKERTLSVSMCCRCKQDSQVNENSHIPLRP